MGHTYLAQKLFPKSRAEAERCFSQGVDLMVKDQNALGILEIAMFLQSKKLCHLAYECIIGNEKKECLTQIIEIDPSFIPARLELAACTASQDRALFQGKTLQLCREQKDIPGLIFLSLGTDYCPLDIALAAWEALQEIEPTRFSSLEFNKTKRKGKKERLIEFIDLFLAHRLPLLELIRPWKNEWCMSEIRYEVNGIYIYLVCKELAGGELLDISSIPLTGSGEIAIFQFLHRLEGEVRRDKSDIPETVHDFFQNFWREGEFWMLFLFLQKHNLDPSLRRAVLERRHAELVFPWDGKVPNIALAKHASFSGADPYLLTFLQTDDYYEAYSDHNVRDFNAVAALAHLLLPKELPRAKEIFQELFPLLLEVTDVEVLRHYVALFSQYNIFPEVRMQLLRKICDLAIQEIDDGMQRLDLDQD